MFLKGCILCLRFFPSTAGLPGCSLHLLQWFCSSLQRRRHPCCPAYTPTASSWLAPRRQLPQTLSQGLHGEPAPLWGLPGADCCSLHQHLGCGCPWDCHAEPSECKALLLSAPHETRELLNPDLQTSSPFTTVPFDFCCCPDFLNSCPLPRWLCAQINLSASVGCSPHSPRSSLSPCSLHPLRPRASA